MSNLTIVAPSDHRNMQYVIVKPSPIARSPVADSILSLAIFANVKYIFAPTYWRRPCRHELGRNISKRRVVQIQYCLHILFPFWGVTLSFVVSAGTMLRFLCCVSLLRLLAVLACVCNKLCLLDGIAGLSAVLCFAALCCAALC